jgi:hypothetical protein
MCEEYYHKKSFIKGLEVYGALTFSKLNFMDKIIQWSKQFKEQIYNHIQYY